MTQAVPVEAPAAVEPVATDAPAPAAAPAGKQSASERMKAAMDAVPARKATPAKDGDKTPEGQAADAVPSPSIGSRLEKLTQAEQKVRKERDEFRAEQAKAKAELDAAKAEVDTFKGHIAALRTDPLGTLAKLGIKYEDLTKAILRDGKPDPLEEVEKLKAEREAEKAEAAKAEKERAERAKEESIRRARAEFTESIGKAAGDATTYPLVAELAAEFDVAGRAYEMIEAEYLRRSPEEQKAFAPDVARKWALDKLEATLRRARGPEVAPAATVAKPAPKAAPTLTNRAASARGSIGGRKMTAQERFEAAKAAIPDRVR